MNRGARLAASLLIFPGLVTTGRAAPPAQPPQPDELAAIAQPLIDRGYARALSIGWIQDGQTHRLYLGRVGLEPPTPPDDQTVFEIGSITKVLTATLLAEATERGGITPDTPIAQLLQRPVDQQGDRTPITLTDLATHYSGLPRLPGNLDTQHPDPYAGYNRGMLDHFLAGHSLTRDRQAGYAYSNLGMGLLGDGLARHASTTYADLIARRIAKPLGMKATTVATPDAAKPKTFAPGHTVDGTAAPPWCFDALAGAGGVRSTLPDMLRFAAAQLDPPDTDLGRAIAATHRPRHDLPAGQAIALGWHRAADRATLWHNGQTAGHSTYLAVNPALGLAVVVLNDTATSATTTLGEALLQRLAGLPVGPLNLTEFVRVDPATLQGLVGRYTLEIGVTLDVTREAERLYARVVGQDRARVFAESDDVFHFGVVEAKLVFQRNAAGQAVGVVLHQNGQAFPGRRVPDEPADP